MGRLSSILRRLRLAPFRIRLGYDSPIPGHKSDNGIYSLVLGVALCAIVFVLVIVCQTNPNLTINQRHGIERVTFLLLLTGGLVSLLKNFRNILAQIKFGSRRKNLTSSDYISMFFISVFLIGYLLQTTLYLIITFDTKTAESSFAMWLARVFWNFLLLVFPIGQTILFFTLWRYAIRFGNHLRKFSAITLALNAAMWVLNVLEESDSVDSEHYIIGVDNKSVEISNGTISVYGVWMDTIGPFTRPMAVEYTLMSLSIILSMWGKAIGTGQPRNANNVL